MFVPAWRAAVRLVRSRSTTSRRVPRRCLSASLEGDKFVLIETGQIAAGGQTPAPMKFPSIWLRDNCYCSQCFHQSSQSRRIDWDDFDTSVKALAIQIDAAKQEVIVKWSDQHESTYSLKWLLERQFNEQRRRKYLDEFYRPKPKHWAGADFTNITEIFKFQDVMHDDEALRQWLEVLSVRGVAIIEDAPIEQTVVRQVAERVGFIRRTTYGEEFIVQAKPGAKNFAYLSHPLPLHTDLPYYEYKPSVNILHCLVQSESKGGSNLLVDGFHIADRMRAEHPQDYEVLTRTLVDWNDIGAESGKSFHNIWRAPVICLDSDGNYARINHSVPQRDSHFSVPLEEVLPWYEAYAKFVRLARRDAFAFKTKPGDVLTFNNIRLMHGRAGYDDTERNVRYIVGAYLDWDIIYSRLRVLKTSSAFDKLPSETAETKTPATKIVEV